MDREEYGKGDGEFLRQWLLDGHDGKWKLKVMIVRWTLPQCDWDNLSICK